MRAILQMLREIRDHAAQVTYKITQRRLGEGWLDHGPIHAHLVERINQAHRVQPVGARGVAAFACRAIEDEKRRAVREERAFIFVERKFPTCAPPAQIKFSRRESQAFLHQVARETHDALWHILAGMSRRICAFCVMSYRLISPNQEPCGSYVIIQWLNFELQTYGIKRNHPRTHPA